MHNLERFLLSSCLLALIGLVGWGCKDNNGNGDLTLTPDNDFQSAAKTAFNRLKEEVFDNSANADCSDKDSTAECNYWQLGNSFDTIIDYFLTDSSEAANFTSTILNTWNNTEGPDNKAGAACWYDDFGWFGIAALKASQHPELWGIGTNVIANCDGVSGEAGPPVDQFNRMADCAWNKMNDNASDIWDDCVSGTGDQLPNCQKLFGELEPLILGGVWNYFWSLEKKDTCNTPCNPVLCSDPLMPSNNRVYCSKLTDTGDPPCSSCNFCGTQNTVTNGLYLVLSSRRNEIEAANRELDFLMQWFNFEPKEKALLNKDIIPVGAEGVDVPLAIVRERVSTYFDMGDAANFRPELAWIADQGLILGGLVDLMRTLDPNSPEYKELLSLAKEIIAGVTFYMVDEDGHMVPWKDPASSTNGGTPIGEVPLPIGDPPGNDYPDYNTGPGVYMRYLLYAFKNNEDLRQFLLGQAYQDFVRTNAEFVMSGNSYCPELTTCDTRIDQTNRLATLVAAIEMIPRQCDLKNEDSSCQVCADAMPPLEACCPLTEPGGCGTVQSVLDNTICKDDPEMACLVGK